MTRREQTRLLHCQQVLKRLRGSRTFLPSSEPGEAAAGGGRAERRGAEGTDRSGRVREAVKPGVRAGSGARSKGRSKGRRGGEGWLKGCACVRI